jgi:uncharacterized protein YcfJ|tara:strand:- start:212 stop:709 length:498 start_codon:yes stop_codon:yes gene_type:complete
MKTLLATVAVLGFATAAHAAEYATITFVKPNYRTISTPSTQQVCKTVDVPIYGRTGQASTGDTLFGAIIGGAIGNQVGNGNGKDVATVLGAIIGADVANKNSGQQQIIGYQQEHRCNNVTTYRSQEELKNYTINYEWRGVQGSTVTYNNYRVGDRLPIEVTIRAK